MHEVSLASLDGRKWTQLEMEEQAYARILMRRGQARVVGSGADRVVELAPEVRAALKELHSS